MARYAQELLTALAEHPRGGLKYELVTSEDLHEQYYSDAYAVSPILPRLKHRKDFSNKAAWVAGRVAHYAQREQVFLRWLEGRADVAAVHVQEWAVWAAAWMMKRIRRMGKKTFYTVHNIYPHRYPALIPKWQIHRWMRNAYLECDGLFVHTERLGRELAAFIGEGAPPIHVTPHGVWTVERGEGERVPGIDERAGWKKLLFFGQIRRNKGLDVLLRAAEKLPDYSITIAGEPHEKEYYRGEIVPMIEKLRARGVKIEQIDRFIAESEVPKLLASHTAMVMPYTQGFVAQSGVIFLALAHEMPVVASVAGGLKDLFEEFRVGVTFEEPTPEAVAAAVRELENAGARLQIANEIEAARQRYSWREAASATIAGYLTTEQESRNEVHDCAVATSSAQ
jgi:glycosyltransferase involved in cell wall biosynthesis